MNSKTNYNLLKAFTLAEVLITLAVIGIVAALTIPNLVQSYKKRVIETRLKKFYSSINQAIKLSEIENGPREYWQVLDSTVTFEDWYNKYLKKYLNVSNVKTTNNSERKILIYFLDSSMLAFSDTSWIFYPNAKDYSELTENNTDGENNIVRDKKVCGTKYFTFMYSNDSGIVPYGYKNAVYDNVEYIKNNTDIGCTKEPPSNERALCTLWIMKNGWEIPDDYPLKF